MKVHFTNNVVCRNELRTQLMDHVCFDTLNRTNLLSRNKVRNTLGFLPESIQSRKLDNIFFFTINIKVILIYWRGTRTVLPIPLPIQYILYYTYLETMTPRKQLGKKCHGFVPGKLCMCRVWDSMLEKCYFYNKNL